MLKKLHTQKYTFQKYRFLEILVLFHVWLIYIFHNFSNFYIKFSNMYFISYTMLLNPQTNEKYFKNIFIFKNLFISYFRSSQLTSRSTVTISGQLGRPAGRPGPFGRGRARCTSVGRPGRSTVNPCGRPTGRPTASH